LFTDPHQVMALNLTLEFSGGAELLFDKIKKHAISLSTASHSVWTIKELLNWIKATMLKERPELFIQGDTVRPGILVLVNGVDWELCGELDYVIENNDVILFISTLHGG